MTGDGGNGNDQGTGHIEPGGNAQNLGTLLGKVLRVNVNADDFLADNTKNYAIPPTNPFVGTPNALRAKSSPTACEIPSAPASIARRATCGSATSAKAPARKSTSSPPAATAARTTAGASAKERRQPGGVGGALPPGNVEPVYDYDRSTGALRRHRRIGRVRLSRARSLRSRACTSFSIRATRPPRPTTASGCSTRRTRAERCRTCVRC